MLSRHRGSFDDCDKSGGCPSQLPVDHYILPRRLLYVHLVFAAAARSARTLNELSRQRLPRNQQLIHPHQQTSTPTPDSGPDPSTERIIAFQSRGADFTLVKRLLWLQDSVLSLHVSACCRDPNLEEYASAGHCPFSMTTIMARPMYASVLPCIKCSDCGVDIPISEMGDHICSGLPGECDQASSSPFGKDGVLIWHPVSHSRARTPFRSSSIRTS